MPILPPSERGPRPTVVVRFGQMRTFQVSSGSGPSTGKTGWPPPIRPSVRLQGGVADSALPVDHAGRDSEPVAGAGLDALVAAGGKTSGSRLMVVGGRRSGFRDTWPGASAERLAIGYSPPSQLSSSSPTPWWNRGDLAGAHDQCTSQSSVRSAGSRGLRSCVLHMVPRLARSCDDAFPRR